MNTHNIDSNKNPSEASSKNTKTELSEEELAKVTGGKLHEAATNGVHIPKVVIEF